MNSLYPRGQVAPLRYLPSGYAPAETDGFLAMDTIEEQLGRLMADSIDPALDDFIERISALFPSIHIEGTPSNRILTQAFNDAIDLVRDVRQGRGRPAALLSRALFEHLINYCTVEDSREAAKRYVDSQAVTANLMLRDLESGAFGDQAQQVLPEYRRLSSADQLPSIVAEHGPRIGSSTFTANLFDRATMCGHGADYDGYRLLSQAVHGSAGGAAGLTVESAGALPVHRLGPSLGIAPFAYRWGFRWFLQLIHEMSRRHPELGTQHSVNALESVLELTGEYFSATQQLDQWIQPKAQPRDPQVLALIVLRKGGERWYAFYPHLNMVTKALTPDSANEILAKFIDQIDPMPYVIASAGRDVTLIAYTEVEPMSDFALPAHGLLRHDPKTNRYDADFWQDEDGLWQWSGSIRGGRRIWKQGPGL